MVTLQNIADRSALSLGDVEKLEKSILKTGYFSPEKARSELDWFLNILGIDEYYFTSTSVEDIAGHLVAISASGLISRYGGEDMGIQLINEHEEHAVYIVEEKSSSTEEIEKRIEENYPSFKLESYRTKEKTGKYFLRLYIVTRPQFSRLPDKPEQLTFEEAADKNFLARSADETVARYRQAWEAMNDREFPYIAVTEKPENNETRIQVGIHSGRIHNFLFNFSHLFYKYKMHSNRKYLEVFADKKNIYTFYFDKIDPGSIEEFSRDLVGVVMLPDHYITGIFQEEIFSTHQTIYAISAASFTHQYLTALTREYSTLSNALHDQPEALGILNTLKLSMTKDAYSEERIAATVKTHHATVALLHKHFEQKFHPAHRRQDLAALEKEINKEIKKNVPSDKDKIILKYFLSFNKAIIKTNFFMRDKRCIAYKLDPSFLAKDEYQDKPFALFFFVGREFLGFHLRFRDIARGGIRIVRSRNHSQYENNLNTIFAENYNLASTQQKKNKDIPEGGSKGTILLHEANQDEAQSAFISYIDSMLDLLTPEDEVLDSEVNKDILFLGPDEGTAELMNWAVGYAHKRKYPFWKAFTTGKAPELGGVPHDMYGMTTASVHEYVLGVLKNLGLQEEQMVKIQTGGPDGDLGSNEILSSRDKTIAIIDGSGVVYDPAGMNRRELTRLAKKRIMVEHFDRSLLTKEGFFVSINDQDITLPNGTPVPNGEDFRNKFHLHPLATSDLFVPCGGRPAAININNWKELLNDKGKPKFRIIIEGANLFITEEARLRLEEQGIIVFKDASTNKGGVTSSSFEVYAALAMSDREFNTHMVFKEGKMPDFRRKYIEEILSRIKYNARSEFNVLWQEHEAGNTPFTRLTNLLSNKINEITDSVVNSELVANKRLKEKIIGEYTPECLVELAGLKNILARVPDNYLNAIVATRLATGFIYKYGLQANEVDFYHYIGSFS